MKTSVTLCTYNGEKYLREQLYSILNQTVPVDEIVVCDDGSADATLEILEEYKIKYPEIFKIHINTENLGYVKNFEQAINLCKGDIIFLCDQDDLWEKNKVEVVLEHFKTNKKINVLCHNIGMLKGNELIHTTFWNEDGFNTNFTNEEILKYILFYKNVFPGMSMALTKEAKNKFLPLKKINSTIIHDYEIVIRACHDNSFAMIPEILTKYRLHDNQSIGFELESASKKKDIYLEIKRIDFIKQAIDNFNIRTNVLEEYKGLCRENYKKFLSQFPFFQRIVTHMKYKYYYKVLNEL